MLRTVFFRLYGGLAYGLGLLSLIAFALFANNGFVELGIWFDDPVLGAFAIDLPTGGMRGNPYLFNMGLIALFGLQHSIMARPGFKAMLTKVLPAPLERSTYILATALAIFTLVLFWQPMVDLVWQVEMPWLRTILHLLFWVGWAITFFATQMIDGLHLMGVKQSFGAEKPQNHVKAFVTPAFYKFVRHPIQTGIIIAMLATPDMTVGRALLAIGMIGYIFIGLYFEERDLVGEFGDTYRDYRKRVPALFPKFW